MPGALDNYNPMNDRVEMCPESPGERMATPTRTQKQVTRLGVERRSPTNIYSTVATRNMRIYQDRHEYNWTSNHVNPVNWIAQPPDNITL